MSVLALLGAGAISTSGNVMAMVAVPWFVLQTTGSPSRAGLTGAAAALGTVLAGFFGGPVVDRLGFRRTSVLADLASAVTVALVPLFYLTVGLQFWQLVALVFSGALLDTPGMSARDALIPEVARQAGMTLERANSANAAVPRFAWLLGPPAAGVLVAAFGATSALWLNAATFVLSAALVAAVPAPARGAEGAGGGGYFGDLLEGARFVRGHALVLSVMLIVAVTNLLDGPLTSVLLPVYARVEYGSATSLGLMLGAFNVGALAGTVVFGALGHRLPRRLAFVFCFLAAGPSPFFVLAAAPPLPVAVGGLALGGLFAGPLDALILTVLQERTPPSVRGRVIGATYGLTMGGIPLGMVMGGYLVEGVGLLPALAGMGACYLIVTLVVSLNPALRGMNAPGVQGASEAPLEETG